MNNKNDRSNCWLRGYMSVLEISPTTSRKEARDKIIRDQLNSPALVWQQVGELLKGAVVSEYARKKTRAQAGRIQDCRAAK